MKDSTKFSFRNLTSTFFYHFTKIAFVSKMKSHGRLIAINYDIISIMVSWILSCWILLDTLPRDFNIDKVTHAFILISQHWKSVLLYLIWIVPPQIFFFWFFGLYRGFWRFASIQDLKKILFASLLGGMFTWIELRIISGDQLFGSSPLFDFVYPNQFSIPQAIILPRYITALLYSVFLVIFLSSARLFVRFAKEYKHSYGDYKRVIIVGAGNAGEGLVRDLLRDQEHHYKPIIFVDDDLRKLGREIHNIRVAGTSASLPSLIKKYNIDLVLFAIPSASSANVRSIVDICEKSKVHCYTLPGLKDLTDGRVSINLLRSISLEDLLGRYPVTCNLDLIRTNLRNKKILITGGGGSIGSELCRQVASLGNFSKFIIVDNNEFNLYKIDMELKINFPDLSIESILLNVTDRIGIQRVLEEHRPDFVFHAAAYKHVPLLEYQPRIAIYNNILGTKVLAEESVRFNVEKFVLISSDKAVNPTNVMGATKRAAEYFCQNLNNKKNKTQFITVRFGNVLDSAGSVIPLFRNQIQLGGPVTVTHPDITRFFMTIPEASQLILQASFLGNGGEIFVLDMGDPIKIQYLAEQMIRLAGKVVNKDIKIIYTGLRPGEKLYEECFYSNENLCITEHTKILRANTNLRKFSEIQEICQELETLCQKNFVENREFLILLKKLVPEFNSKAFNHLSLEQQTLNEFYAN